MTPQVPLVSSKRAVSAFRRAGFEERGDPSPGSHQAFVCDMGDHRVVITIPLGKKEIPRPTLRNIIRQAEMTVEEFLGYLR